MTYTIKAVGDWTLDVLGVPFGGPDNGRDAQGEFFSHATEFHADKFGLPPVVYYHGYGDDKRPAGKPEYIGKAVSREERPDGIWYRVILDRASKFARRVWEAAQAGTAAASSGSIEHLARFAKDGFIREWPVAELSVFETAGGKAPSNTYAVALPILKAVYTAADMDWRPELYIDPKAEDIGATAQRSEAKIDNGTTPNTTQIKDREMSDETTNVEVGRAVAEAVKAAMLERDEATKAAAVKAAELEDAKIEAAKEAVKAYEEQLKTSGRLPTKSDDSPNIAKYSDLWKYDNLDPADQAVMIGILQAAKDGGRSRGGASEEAVKALVVKISEAKEDHYNGAKSALKAFGFDADAPNPAAKANELNYSTLASGGNDWIGVTYSNELWREIAQDTPIVGKLPTVVVPQGSESITIPVQGAAPTFYVVAQATAQAANPGAITRTMTTSKQTTSSASLTVAKLGAATYYTGELEEDSVVPWASELRASMQQEGAEVLEHVVIDGDTDGSATTNINDIGGTPAATDTFMLLNGFRKLCLITNTANSRDGGAMTDADFLETLKLMGLGGRNATNRDKVGFIIDLWTHWKALELVAVKTRDVFSNPTIENGQLTGIYGYSVDASANMHRWNTDATYGLKANSAGKVDVDTASNNTTGSILAVRWDQWRLGYKRRITFETQRVPSADSTEITALMRVGLINRDTDASAISYNITV